MGGWVTDLKSRSPGHSFMMRNKKLTFSMTWSWKFLLVSGFVSRKRSCKRPAPVEVLKASMIRWLHCVREKMLKYRPALLLPPWDESAAPAMAPPAINAYDTDDEGPLIEPNPAKQARSMRVQKSLATQHHRVRRWEYGYFALKQRFHSDQSGLNLDANMERSYVPAESADLVQISGQASGCKRFCSLQVSMHGCPDSVQPDIGSERS